jgi:hypothetical protein
VKLVEQTLCLLQRPIRNRHHDSPNNSRQRMTPREWPAETKQRAEKAMADLEAFYGDFCNRTPFGRRPETPKLEQLHSRVMGAS